MWADASKGGPGIERAMPKITQGFQKDTKKKKKLQTWGLHLGHTCLTFHSCYGLDTME